VCAIGFDGPKQPLALNPDDFLARIAVGPSLLWQSKALCDQTVNVKALAGIVTVDRNVTKIR